ncbi:PHP domain-containing protein, partial [Candidatus Berkelbacteria bacterium]|nr:PHP domain-containing protein [Candidatus Berkelbacteria bacterium]
MINQKLSQLMRDIADLKEVLGENRFKVVAYQKAAQILSSLSDDLEVIYKTKGLAGLKEIDGVGDAIAGHIEEFIKHHNVKEWERLKKKVAPAVLKLMDIPGIGPKTALKLADTLEVISVAGLQKALANVTPKTAVKLAKIGLKEKSINKILQGIDIAAKLDRRMRYVDAETIVREVENYMKRAPGIIKFDVVGSFRRKRETVGDLDFIATAADPGKAVAYFLKGPFVDKVIAHGPTKTTVIEPNGQQLDLEILPLREYGSLLQHFTGSKEHNVALRTWAVAHGFSISEHGIKVKGKLKRCSDEACVYQTLGMDWIPPELREDRGEIQAALAKQLPKLIETKDLKGDLQMHSNWSDGHATIYEMAKTAQKLGHEYIAITDHSPAVSVAHGLDAKRLAKQQKEIIGAQKKLNIKILSGCEVDIRADATLDLPDDVLKTLDFVICSIHSAFGQPKEQITKRLLAAL